MIENFICKKVNSLLSSYIKGDLDELQKKFVSEHLKKCPVCRNNCRHLKNLIEHLQNEYNNSLKNTISILFNPTEHEKYLQNLSAYCDNELPFEESVKLKKYLIRIPIARKELKNICLLREVLNKHNLEIQKQANFDLSKEIVSKIYGKKVQFNLNLVLKTASIILFVCLAVTAILGITILNSKNTDFSALSKKYFEKIPLTQQLSRNNK